MLGKLRTDEDGHWYLIPYLYLEEFKELKRKLEGKRYIDDSDQFDLFEEFFGRFRIDSPFSVKCIMDEEYY